MSEEEKKAIEVLSELKNMKLKVSSILYSSATVLLDKKEKKAIDTVLNLITKLQKENEIKIKGFENEELICSKFTEKVGKDIIDYKFEYENNQKIIDELQKEKEEKDKEIETLKRDFKIVDQECSRLERKEAKQDKIIDLILDKVNLNYAEIFYSNEVKEIIEIYEKTKNTNNLSRLELRKSCIKQYFEQEATN